MFVTLSPEQSRIAQAVAVEGYAVSSIETLLAGDPCYGALRDLAVDFANSKHVKERHAAFLRGERQPGQLKPFIVKFQDVQYFTGKEPLFRFGLLPAIHQTACACLGRFLTYYSADLWCVLPDAEQKPREWSQSWHRDPEADRLIKVFLFLEDVAENGGPLEYVARSHNGGYSALCPPRRYPENGEHLDRNIPPEARRRFVAPAGTLVFADTSGLHRGGYTKDRRRLNCVFTFLPDARQPKYTLESWPTDLTEIQRAAIHLN